MSVKVHKRFSSKKKKPALDSAQAEVLSKLGLEAFLVTPLDSISMLDISTWRLENKAPLLPKDLPHAFLQRLWLLSPDARHSCCVPSSNGLAGTPTKDKIDNGLTEESQSAVNPLDLITAVYMSANSFLQQEITMRMVQCQFAVPLVLPGIYPQQPSTFLLWPLRGVVSQWWPHCLAITKRALEGDLASTEMPMVSCVKLGHCGVSKSRVLSLVMGGPKATSEAFLHRRVDGGQLHRKLSNGLVELGWYLPSGDLDRDLFPLPLVMSNLRGDAAAHAEILSLLCRASSAVIVFCEHLSQKEKSLLASCKSMGSQLLIINLSQPIEEGDKKRVVGFVEQNLEKELGLIEGSVLTVGGLSEEKLAEKLREAINILLLDNLKLVTLEAAAKTAEELGLSVDEGPLCKKAMAEVEEVLTGLEEGSVQFREKQLPLQGALWSKLTELDKAESKQKKGGEAGGEVNTLLEKEKKDILLQLSSYRMTPAMKVFIDSLFTTDTIERTYFLSWMKLKLRAKQIKQRYKYQHELRKEVAKKKTNEHKKETNDDGVDDDDSFCTVSTVEEAKYDANLSEELSIYQTANTGLKYSETQQQKVEEEHVSQKHILEESAVKSSFHENSHENQKGPECQPEIFDLVRQGKQLEKSILKPEQSNLNSGEKSYKNLDSSTGGQEASKQPCVSDCSFLGIEHFLREMGIIFELTHTSPSSGIHNVQRLPSLAADLLLYGIPLELMDGDASNIPSRWLCCVFTELKRRLPRDGVRLRVLTNLGVHHANNSEVLSALFGVNFPSGAHRSTRGVYMLALPLSDDLRGDLECDFLIMIDVEGLCSPGQDKEGDTQVHDNEMATLATGLSDVLMHNIAAQRNDEFESNLCVIVNALLRNEVCGYTPINQLQIQNEELNSKLQALQIGRIAEILQTETDEIEANRTERSITKNKSSIPCVIGPWQNIALTEPVDKQYSKVVLLLKQNLFEALKKCSRKSQASGLPEFMGRLCAVWEALKAESFSIGLENTEIAVAFTMLCTELSQWQKIVLDHMESWVIGPTERIMSSKIETLETETEGNVLIVLRDEAREEVKKEVDKIRSKLENYMIKDDLHKTYIKTYTPHVMKSMNDFQEQLTGQMMESLESAKEKHYSSTQFRNFKNLLEKEQESKLLTLVENNKLTNVVHEDLQLEEEFENVWNSSLSKFTFRPSETNITATITAILKKNLLHRGLQKHFNKLEDMKQKEKETSGFLVTDEHFGYRSRLKHMFKDNNRLQRLEAHRLTCNIIEEYNQFVADKSKFADFSDSYIMELLENVERSLRAKPMEIRSAFEVDLKVYLCGFACKDFQKAHDRYTKDRDLLTFINGSKNRYLGEFIYQFRKRDQCKRVARAFTNMVLKPTALDYIYRPLGKQIVAEMVTNNGRHYQSPLAFNCSLLKELLEEDSFESFLEYLLSYERFSLRRIHKRVEAHLSESKFLIVGRQQRLGEIVGKMAATVSQTAEGVSGVLCDTKFLLKRMCFILEKDEDVDVDKTSLEGPLFSITTQWNRFVSCLLEALGELRLALAQEFSQNVDVLQLLNALPIKTHDCLFKRVRGCGMQCPFCRAPCEIGEMEHEMHNVVLHRPKGMLSYTCDDPCSLSHTSCPSDIVQDNTFLNKDTERKALAYKDYRSVYPDWSISPKEPNANTPIAYWRYVLARFNGRFAEEYQREPAHLPEEWQNITKEEALESLKTVLLG